MNKVPLTARGAEQLRVELHELKTDARPKVIKAIAVGARDQQGFIEARIRDIEHKLGHAQVIDVTQLDAGGKVVFGATVELLDEESGAEVRYQIVGEDEANIKAGRVSITSPIARALIGKQEGDVVDLRTPGGDRSYEILAVEYV